MRLIEVCPFFFPRFWFEPITPRLMGPTLKSFRSSRSPSRWPSATPFLSPHALTPMPTLPSMRTWTRLCSTPSPPRLSRVRHASLSQCCLIDLIQPDSTASITYNPALPVTNLGTIDAFPDVPDIKLVPLKAVPAPPPSRRIALLVSPNRRSPISSLIGLHRQTSSS
jgi:hypothetical protein